LKKNLSVVLKIKYDIENLALNSNRIDNILTEVVLTNERSVLNQEDSITINNDNDYSLMLPLHNEDVLIEFENKLLNKSFRLNVVSYSLCWYINMNMQTPLYVYIIHINNN